jgi:hypothetical protein
MDLKETGCGAVDWTQMAEDSVQWGAHMNTVMKLWVLLTAGNFMTR